jgi:hypothetical protein
MIATRTFAEARLTSSVSPADAQTRTEKTGGNGNSDGPVRSWAHRRGRWLSTQRRAREIHRVEHANPKNTIEVAQYFQALRRTVNGESEVLVAAMAALPSLLSPLGRVAALSFHPADSAVIQDGLAAGGLHLEGAALRPSSAYVRSFPQSRWVHWCPQGVPFPFLCRGPVPAGTLRCCERVCLPSCWCVCPCFSSSLLIFVPRSCHLLQFAQGSAAGHKALPQVAAQPASRPQHLGARGFHTSTITAARGRGGRPSQGLPDMFADTGSDSDDPGSRFQAGRARGPVSPFSRPAQPRRFDLEEDGGLGKDHADLMRRMIGVLSAPVTAESRAEAEAVLREVDAVRTRSPQVTRWFHD